jgi:hypothetical protein
MLLRYQDVNVAARGRGMGGGPFRELGRHLTALTQVTENSALPQNLNDPGNGCRRLLRRMRPAYEWNRRSLGSFSNRALAAIFETSRLLARFRTPRLGRLIQ